MDSPSSLFPAPSESVADRADPDTDDVDDDGVPANTNDGGVDKDAEVGVEERAEPDRDGVPEANVPPEEDAVDDEESDIEFVDDATGMRADVCADEDGGRVEDTSTENGFDAALAVDDNDTGGRCECTAEESCDESDVGTDDEDDEEEDEDEGGGSRREDATTVGGGGGGGGVCMVRACVERGSRRTSRCRTVSVLDWIKR